MIEHAAPAVLDWRSLPLDARALIEASAGTGKTYTIGLIYVRLLLERDLGVEQILVATFTDAAAQELRERLRRRIVEVEQWLQGRDFSSGVSAEVADADPLAGCLADLCPDAASTQRALRRIQRARADLDRAPISTIHALCQRIQRDYPLQSHAAFAGDTLRDESELVRECVEDFWRRRYLTGAIDEGEAEAVAGGGPQALLRDVAALASGAHTAIEADGEAALRAQIEALSHSAVIERLHAWAADKTLYGSRKTALAGRLRDIALILQQGDDVRERLAAKLDRYFDPGEIDVQQAPDARERLRDDPLMHRLQRTRVLLRLRRVFARGAVLAAAAAVCREEIPRRARRRNVMTFSMLIDELHARLIDAQSGAALADCLHAAFPAALIDEFQDTDQRQYAIFDRIYRDGAGHARGSLVMIGDPKQAIYGFRGGDIAAYLRASAHTALRFSLATNHRSSRALIGAMNALYGDSGGGFGDSGIDYRAVAATDKFDAEEAYAIAGVAVARPLIVHPFRGDALDGNGHAPTSLAELERLALDDCADRIAAQLNDAAQTLGACRVGPGDIAVLLSTNAQVAALRKRLVERRVPCVGSGRGSVFEGEVARDLELILRALVESDDEGAVRAALSTRLLGARLVDFNAWQDDAQAFERELERFENWREHVRVRGVLVLIEDLLALRAPALLAAGDGERSVTDLRHLGELLAEQEPARQGLAGLLAWFAGMRRGGDDGDHDAAGARQLRIESDARRVQLLTIHASKGLEFAIVYLPLIWRIADRSGLHAPKVLRFHDAHGNPCVDFGSTQFAEHCALHFMEDLHERQRLLYVALTRARHAVHVYWVDRGVVPDGDRAHAAQAWRVAAVDLLLAGAAQRAGLACTEASLASLAAALDGVDVQAGKTAATRYVSAASSQAARATQTPLPALRAFQWLHSFSSLVRQATPAAESVELPAAAIPDAGDDARLLALYALRGPRFGDAVHSLLEHASSGPLEPDMRNRAARELALRALRTRDDSGADLIEQVVRLVERTRRCDLGGGLRLAHLADAARVREFEFQFPVRQVSVARLRALCAVHGHADALPASLDAVTLNGMLTGFADLVFEWQGRYHVLDYKTNWLGACTAHYRGTALDAAMGDHHYALQALLYTVALHRYLRQRLRDYAPRRHLGESWYLFVRALGLAPDAGVWRRQWSPALIEALDDAFAGTGVAA